MLRAQLSIAGFFKLNSLLLYYKHFRQNQGYLFL